MQRPGAAVVRRDMTVESEPGVTIAVREVVPDHAALVPVLLIHGAGGGGVASFDVAVPGYSLAEDLARAGHATYLLDVRGWGGSTRPAALDAPALAGPPAVGSDEAVHDIGAVVAWIRARHPGAVALVGWATGGHWTGLYAANHADEISHLVMLNALYGTPGPWSLRARLEDEGRPGQLSASLGAYAVRDAANLVRAWEASIPVKDKATWRDPRVAEAYTSIAIASDPTSTERNPPSVRVPTGPLRDSYELASGARTWNAAAIRAATLVVRSELDFWSRREDIAALRRELVGARRVEILELPGATHFVFLDRPEHGRSRLVATLSAFLAQP
jgi:pimeloyl-ACP methyl ester carboxylesterase